MILNRMPRGKSKAKRPPAFTYTGRYTYMDSVREDGTVDWELALLTSGTLTFSRVVASVDAFLVGPGSDGQEGYFDTTGNDYHGGRGGSGGETKTVSGISVAEGTDYSAVIGAEGTATRIFGSSAASGGGKTGGAGGSVSGNGADGQDGVLSFDGSGTRNYYPNYRYGASGGGGGVKTSGFINRSPGSGGANGAGNGGTFDSAGGDAGTNSGSGGGGGGANVNGPALHAGGSGNSGIIIIRNAR
jgi:hypothetical protein